MCYFLLVTYLVLFFGWSVHLMCENVMAGILGFWYLMCFSEEEKMGRKGEEFG